jgi:phosphopantetheinyl transferase (holo-ACP synthase)
MLLGNDVVDRKENGAEGKHLDLRFVRRVFTAGESGCIQNSHDPSLALWMIWAAKESLFKVMRKLDPDVVFAHKDFPLTKESLSQISRASPRSGSLSAKALHQDLDFALLWDWSPEFVHCLAGYSGREGFCAQTLDRGALVRVETLGNREGCLSARELESVHSVESREVRLLAKALLETHRMRNVELVRRRSASSFSPPELLQNGKPVPGIDLSLSHDGRFVAAAVSTNR